MFLLYHSNTFQYLVEESGNDLALKQRPIGQKGMPAP